MCMHWLMTDELCVLSCVVNIPVKIITLHLHHQHFDERVCYCFRSEFAVCMYWHVICILFGFLYVVNIPVNTIVLIKVPMNLIACTTKIPDTRITLQPVPREMTLEQVSYDSFYVTISTLRFLHYDFYITIYSTCRIPHYDSLHIPNLSLMIHSELVSKWSSKCDHLFRFIPVAVPTTISSVRQCVAGSGSALQCKQCSPFPRR